MTPEAKKRLRLAQAIYNCESRLQKLKEMYAPNSLEFRYRSRNLKPKIKQLKEERDRIDNKVGFVREANKKATEFFGFSLEGIAKMRGKRGEERLAIKIFCKYVLDNYPQVRMTQLASFLGFKEGRTIAYGRRNLIKSFSTEPKNKEIYQQFKNYELLSKQ